MGLIARHRQRGTTRKVRMFGYSQLRDALLAATPATSFACLAKRFCMLKKAQAKQLLNVPSPCELCELQPVMGRQMAACAGTDSRHSKIAGPVPHAKLLSQALLRFFDNAKWLYKA